MNTPKTLLITLLVLLTSHTVWGQSIELINSQSDFARKASMLTNGYARKISGDDITYSNLWDTQDQAFLTRTTTGKMAIVWASEPTKVAPDGHVHFFLLVCVDQANAPLKFNFYINDRPYGAFTNFHEATQTVDLSHGARADFRRIGRNDWGDGACFMELTVPASQLSIGQPATFKLVGENASANNWFMVFKNKDLVRQLVHRSETDACFSLKTDGGKPHLVAPQKYSGTAVHVSVNGKKPQTVRFVARHSESILDLSSLLTKNESLQALRVGSADHEWFAIDRLATFKDSIYLDGHTLVKWSRPTATEYMKQCSYSTAPDYLARILKAPWQQSRVHIMVSSHQDIAWMDTPYRCIEKRDDVIITPALELLKKHPDYRYDIEDVLMVEEYIARNPRKRAEIAHFLANGQLGVGASYTQPYEEMQTGEALVRQFYYGQRYLKENFNGYQGRSYWNVDVPGRTLQMPQILKKSGVEGLQYSRHERGLYRWMSPDSSTVMVHTPGHYGVAAQFLRKTPEEGLESFYTYVETLPDVRSDKSKAPVIGMLSAEDMAPAHTYYNWIDKFAAFSDRMKSPMPKLQHSTSDRFFADLKQSNPVLPILKGERPDIWMYIHGPGHERALTTYRAANRKAQSAETFSTIATLLRPEACAYPKRELDAIWKDLIYADHGWGGNGGHVTDSLFHARYRESDTLAGQLTEQAVRSIASQIRFNDRRGTPLVVFNPLSVVHSAPVTFTVDPRDTPIDRLTLTDAKGQEIAYQISGSTPTRVTLEFIAQDLPSVGYVTYYLKARRPKHPSSAFKPEESAYYTLSFNDGQLTQITDRTLNIGLFDTAKFDIGEILSMRSVGNGAGEFSSIQRPSMEEFESTRTHQARWQPVSTGPVYTLYKSETPFADATIVRYLKLYKQIKRIDFPTEVLGFTGRDYREFRQAFPMRRQGQVSYDVPFGIVQVGKDEIAQPAGERYLDQPSDIHPRSVTNWIGYSDAEVTAHLSSSVVVADYIDPTPDPVSQTVLQPILFASRRSCHWLGEFYAQKGDHHFQFSLRTDRAGDATSGLQAIAANHVPSVVYAPESYRTAHLPECLSFFSIDAPHLYISALKKHEDSPATVIRLYDSVNDGSATDAHLRSYFPVKSTQQTDLLEYPVKAPSEASLHVGNCSIETYLLR